MERRREGQDRKEEMIGCAAEHRSERTSTFCVAGNILKNPRDHARTRPEAGRKQAAGACNVVCPGVWPVEAIGIRVQGAPAGVQVQVEGGGCRVQGGPLRARVKVVSLCHPR